MAAEKKEFNPEQVMNGTWGEVWFDGEYLAQIISFKAEITHKTTSVTRVQKLMDGQKLTGLEAKGELKLHHINSHVMNKMSESLKQGKLPKNTIIAGLNDPEAKGMEKVTFSGCKLDKTILMDWEAGKNCEESYSFTFEDWTINNSVKA